MSQNIFDIIKRIKEYKGLNSDASVSRILGFKERVTPHLLRHSFATHLMGEGVNLKFISKLLGHSAIGITADIYTHVSIEHMRKAQNLIDKV